MSYPKATAMRHYFTICVLLLITNSVTVYFTLDIVAFHVYTKRFDFIRL